MKQLTPEWRELFWRTAGQAFLNAEACLYISIQRMYRGGIMMSFTDQVVVVTGAAQGIGRSVAEAYALAGAKVVLADVQEAEGAAAAASIRHEGGEAIFVHCDVRKEQDIQQLFETAVKEFKQIDVLVNNAGVSRWKSPMSSRWMNGTMCLISMSGAAFWQVGRRPGI